MLKQLPVEVTMEEIKKVFEEANKDSNIHGIMIFRPLPNHLIRKSFAI